MVIQTSQLNSVKFHVLGLFFLDNSVKNIARKCTSYESAESNLQIIADLNSVPFIAMTGEDQAADNSVKNMAWQCTRDKSVESSGQIIVDQLAIQRRGSCCRTKDSN